MFAIVNGNKNIEREKGRYSSDPSNKSAPGQICPGADNNKVFKLTADSS
jgi:hypothetical protein